MDISIEKGEYLKKGIWMDRKKYIDNITCYRIHNYDCSSNIRRSNQHDKQQHI